MTAASSFKLLDDVMAKKVATFIDRWDTEHRANGSKDGLVSTERTRLKSHYSVGFTTGGKVLVRPFRNLAVTG